MARANNLDRITRASVAAVRTLLKESIWGREGVNRAAVTWLELVFADQSGAVPIVVLAQVDAQWPWGRVVAHLLVTWAP